MSNPPPPPSPLSAAFGQLGLGLAGLVSATLEASPAWASLRAQLHVHTTLLEQIGDVLVALTQNQQRAVNELATALNTTSSNLQTVLSAAQAVRNDLAAMTAEEGREEAERMRLEALLAQMDSEVVSALEPLTAQINQMNQTLQTPSEQGGGPLTPEA